MQLYWRWDKHVSNLSFSLRSTCNNHHVILCSKRSAHDRRTQIIFLEVFNFHKIFFSNNYKMLEKHNFLIILQFIILNLKN